MVVDDIPCQGCCVDQHATRVFLADDYEVVRRGIRTLLRDDRAVEIVGESATARDAAARIPALRPDVAVLDVRMPDGNGIDVCRSIRALDPTINVLMLSGYDDHAVEAVSVGARGYLLKSVAGSAIVAAIHTVARGGLAIDPNVLPRFSIESILGRPTSRRRP
jgi:DNA-binding NarL/FixJ family response regulator